ncbi:MAG TPA: urea transporter [Rubrivivax sp.]|nr:urea transporter [Rubrivivax sp.]HPO19683.1 urea transporter [Rubrivivax sp.]
MAVRLGSSGLQWDAADAPPRLAACVDVVLRGVAQVMFQNNAYTGLLFVAGIFYSAPRLGWAALLGSAVGTAAAAWLGAERAQLRAGLYGFNGALVAIGVLLFLQPDAWGWASALFGAAASSVVTAALTQLLGRWNMPALTAPFVFSTLGMLLASLRLGRLQAGETLPPAALPKAMPVDAAASAATVVHGLLNGIGQVFFQGEVISGGLFVLGLLVASRRAGVAALAGSAVGLLAAWVLGAAEPALRAGLYGFNSVLVAIALATVFLAGDAAAWLYALLASAAAVFVAAALSAAFEPFGLPALTLPFVLVTWTFLFAASQFERLRQPGAG